MFTVPTSDATASTVPADNNNVRHMLFGTVEAVQKTVHNLHSRGYAEPNDWSRPIRTGRPNEVMAILTKRI